MLDDELYNELEVRDMERPPVAVIIPVMNQYELAIKALESVQYAGRWEPFIIPNWGNNIGVAPAWNKGVYDALRKGYEYCLIINDDIVLSPSLIDILTIRASSIDYTLVSGTDGKGLYLPDQVRRGEINRLSYDQDIIDAPHFSCFMITKNTIERVGWFDDNFAPAYFEDNDYCHRCVLSGYMPVRSQSAIFYHYGSATQNAGKRVVSSDLFKNNRKYYVEKWGGEPGREQYTHPYNNETLTIRNYKNEYLAQVNDSF